MEEQVKVTIDGRCMVRPAQPTPAHHFFLSCVDIFWQDIHYNQRLVFYESTALSGPALLQQLKSSLAICLVHYYPWCGRLAKDPLPPHRLFIDCNDAGVEFVEASSDLPLSALAHGRFQMKPFFLELSQRPDHKGDSLYRSPLLSIQATLFSDGGVALGVAQSHIVADGHSLWNFLVSWGECSRGVPLSLPPLHNRERLAVPEPSPEKGKWNLKNEEDKEEEEMETSAVEQSDKENGSTCVETLASSGDKVGVSVETFSTVSGNSLSNASTEAICNGDIHNLNVRNDPLVNEACANEKGENFVTQGSKNNGVDKDGTSEMLPPKAGHKGSSYSIEETESKEGTKASIGDQTDQDPLVQCIFDMPSSAVKKLKAEAGDGFTSYEVTCAHFWQRMTIARQSPGCDPTYFAALIDFRTRLTPPLPPAYFGNVITFCLAQSTSGRIGTESLRATASRIHKIIAETWEDRFVTFMHYLETHDNRLMVEGESAPPKGKGVNVASSPRFPAYQVDFGWGTPVAVRPVKAGGEGELVLFGGRPGSNQGDMEICTALPDRVLRHLLEDPHFLAKPPGSPYAT